MNAVLLAQLTWQGKSAVTKYSFCDGLEYVREGLVIVLIAFLGMGCTSQRELVDSWRERRDLSVGQPLELATSKKPVAVNRREHGSDEYTYQDGKCRWTYFVSQTTRLVTGWRYDTNPMNCEASYCFFCSW